jgi:hypothetical protein
MSHKPPKRPKIDRPTGNPSSVFRILSSAPLYNCRGLSTNQPFLCKTNPILSAVGGLQMNLSCLYKKVYKFFIPLAGQKNKPNSNPIKPNYQKAKMNVNLTLTKDYRKNDDFSVRINKPNLVRRRRIANERKYLYHKGL